MTLPVIPIEINDTFSDILIGGMTILMLLQENFGVVYKKLLSPGADMLNVAVVSISR